MSNIRLTDEQKVGYRLAISTLREAAEKAQEQGGFGHLTEWSVFLAGASFLEGQAGVCACRCMEGKHCGGCGHDGCGYRA